MTLLLSAAFVAAGAQVAIALVDPASQSSGTTGAQTTSTCPTPRLGGLPKHAKFTNATVKFKLSNLTSGSTYLISAGGGEVLGGTAFQSTLKGTFQLPDQGPKTRRIPITAVIATDSCENSPWKVQKKIHYKGYAVPAAPKTPPATPAPKATPTPTPTPAVTPKATKTPVIKPPKLPKPLTQKAPAVTPLSVRTWITPIDNGARLAEKLPQPKLARLEQKADKASSNNALIGLAIVFSLFAVSTVAAFMAFRRRDEIQFEAALSAQLSHLEEGDPGFAPSAEEPSTAPFAAAMADSAPAEALDAPAEGEAPTEVLPEPVAANGAAAEGAPAEQPVLEQPAQAEQTPAEVEAELQRILDDAGLQAELQGILADARSEAEQHGVAIDPDLMFQALCEELGGSAALSEPARAELRSKFDRIIAAEAERVPQQAS
jgi:hypothetical protein